MTKNILVLLPVGENEKRMLEEKAPGCSFTYGDHKTLTTEMVQEANIILGNPPVEKVKGSKNLEWLQLSSAGVGGFTNEGVLREGVALTNMSGAYGLAISEYMLGVLLSMFKRLHYYRDNQSEAKWQYEGNVKSIYNSTALVVGLGDIGGEFAKRLKALGAYTIGIRRTNLDKPDYLDELHLMDDLESLLPKADIVALSLPATNFTNKVINKKTLGLMKQDAVLINVGRGTAIDTDDLCDALESGQILGAAMDVTDPEPLPSDHRLWKLKNVIITPHVSGGYSLDETRNRIINISADNLEAFINGKELRNIVDFSAGY